MASIYRKDIALSQKHSRSCCSSCSEATQPFRETSTGGNQASAPLREDKMVPVERRVPALALGEPAQTYGLTQRQGHVASVWTGRQELPNTECNLLGVMHGRLAAATPLAVLFCHMFFRAILL